MAMKAVEELVAGDRIAWDAGGQTQFTVKAVLVIPPVWPSPDQVVVLVTGAGGQERLLDAQYEQQVEVPGW